MASVVASTSEPRACLACGRSEAELDVGQRLQVCRKCQEGGGRNVWYCSRACQVQDWKAGHKNSCGRWSRAEADFFPAPVPPFRRSPALQRQIYLLTHDYSVDYIVIVAHDGGREHVGIKIDEVGSRHFFRLYRDAAMKTGDGDAAAKMIEAIKPLVNPKIVTEAALIEQMAEEYGPGVRAAFKNKIQVAKRRDYVRKMSTPCPFEIALMQGHPSAIKSMQRQTPSSFDVVGTAGFNLPDSLRHIPRPSRTPSDCPLPISPYSHSIALQRQIHILSQNSRVDYVLFNPRAAEPHLRRIGVEIPNAFVSRVFRGLRDTSMESGNPSAVVMMIEILLDVAEEHEMSRDEVVAQLIAEYGGQVREWVENEEEVARQRSGVDQLWELAKQVKT